VILQTMICAIDGKPPPPEEKRAWEELALEIAGSAASLRGVQIYGKARPAPEDPLATALDAGFLEARAASLRERFARAGVGVPVKVYL
jgi:histidinol dehydrogenase